jgi:hypothetical protein
LQAEEHDQQKQEQENDEQPSPDRLSASQHGRGLCRMNRRLEPSGSKN